MAQSKIQNKLTQKKQSYMNYQIKTPNNCYYKNGQANKTDNLNKMKISIKRQKM